MCETLTRVALMSSFLLQRLVWCMLAQYLVRTERFPSIFTLPISMFVINTLYYEPLGWVSRVGGNGGGEGVLGSGDGRGGGLLRPVWQCTQKYLHLHAV